MNQSSMYEMRHSIVKAVSDYVEIEAEDMVEVNVTSEPDMGTVYCVAVPIRYRHDFTALSLSDC